MKAFQWKLNVVVISSNPLWKIMWKMWNMFNSDIPSIVSDAKQS